MKSIEPLTIPELFRSLSILGNELGRVMKPKRAIHMKPCATREETMVQGFSYNIFMYHENDVSVSPDDISWLVRASRTGTLGSDCEGSGVGELPLSISAVEGSMNRWERPQRRGNEVGV